MASEVRRVLVRLPRTSQKVEDLKKDMISGNYETTLDGRVSSSVVIVAYFCGCF